MGHLAETYYPKLRHYEVQARVSRGKWVAVCSYAATTAAGAVKKARRFDRIPGHLAGRQLRAVPKGA